MTEAARPYGTECKHGRHLCPVCDAEYIAVEPNERDRALLERVQLETGRLVVMDIIAAARAEGAAEMRERCELLALRLRDELRPCSTSYRGIGPEWNMANEIATKIRSLT